MLQDQLLDVPMEVQNQANFDIELRTSLDDGLAYKQHLDYHLIKLSDLSIWIGQPITILESVLKACLRYFQDHQILHNLYFRNQLSNNHGQVQELAARWPQQHKLAKIE